MPDAEMKDAETPEVVKEPEEPPKPKVFGFADVQKAITLFEKAAEGKNVIKVLRTFRYNTIVRTKITTKLLQRTVDFYVPDGAQSKPFMTKYLKMLPEDMATEDAAPEEEKPSAEDATPRTTVAPEIEIYLHTLMVTVLLRHDMVEQATACCTDLLQYAHAINIRTVDPFVSKAWFYYSLCFQKAGKLDQIRSSLLAAHRTACLRHDEIGQATLLNLLLRNYIHYNLYDQAFKLVSKTTFPEAISNNQFVRYLYYLAKIHAVQLDYSDAHAKLLQCIRKCPQQGSTALGFRKDIHKLSVIVQLLIGEVPERKVFSERVYTKALEPYFELTQAVRVGSLANFNQILASHVAIFKTDKTYTLILRLRHNVIKTGLRKINVSYSRISFDDICAKLALDNAQDAEFICAKAIRDGVIDATIDHSKGWMQSNEITDINVTNEPQQAFHKRITFCMDVHNEAVVAMQYPPDAHKKDLETPELRAEREKQEEEFAKELEKEEEEDF